MKFAKELDRDLVPEWRFKYLDYKQGKKKVKAVARAVTRANATPRTPALQGSTPQRSLAYGTISAPFISRVRASSNQWGYDGPDDGPDPLRQSSAALGRDSRPQSDESSKNPLASFATDKTPPMAISKSKALPGAAPSAASSFVLTPPSKSQPPFELPDPAIPAQSPLVSTDTLPSTKRRASSDVRRTAYEVGQTTSPRVQRTLSFAPLRSRFSRDIDAPPLLRRMFSAVGTPPTDSQRLDVNMVAVDHVKARQREFFSWMGGELNKVETFYRLKEDESGVRLRILREQLHEMRNRRTQEVLEHQNAKTARKESERAALESHASQSNQEAQGASQSASRDQSHSWVNPIERALGGARAAVLKPRVGANSKALQSMRTSPEGKASGLFGNGGVSDPDRDYVRRPHNENDVPYRVAKKKLKLALKEFYRGMELLKSYALLNRTAFRKINKKYDKATNAHPPLRFMSEKVNTAWFVQSDVLDGHLQAVEDLYARYFERGNHKVATGKLRGSHGRETDQTASAFRSGILIGTGAVFAIQGAIYGANLLSHPDPTIKIQASYLLQIYGGYFLVLYLFSWFCFDCCIWTRNKINYSFVFEFDPRHNLDWRELAEIPSFLIFLLGLFVWLNFSRYGSSAMFLYYPIILICLTALLIFLPIPVLFHRSRRWFVYSHWRLLLAGLYPVEFRDFFLGDMYCSLTYAMSNIELFFCLYAHNWNDPPQCNSSHSRLLGFFSTLPGIWRALQCIRRYHDTRNVFPHLVNCGKYTMTILYYVTLSLYRIKRTNSLLALFTTIAAVNAIYCSIWDILMDWSLLQPQASARFLRDIRGYKNPYWYYLAMFLDPILRFNWIFYSIYTHDLQHSTIVSFLVGLSEASRRGMWTLFRVENEHCSNVARFKASRDVPLPYDLITASEEEYFAEHAQGPVAAQAEPIAARVSPTLTRQRTSTAYEAQESPAAVSLRRRMQPVRTFTKIIADAHTQDFEKKRKPSAGNAEAPQDLRSGEFSDQDERADSSDEEEDEDGEQDAVGVLLSEDLPHGESAEHH